MKQRSVLIAFAAAKVLLHLLCINQYGIFRDELYYLACGEHLDWGYVDQPPAIALVAWLARHLFGDSLLAIRIFAVLAGAGTVYLSGAIARRLGGATFAQALACLCALVAPVYLATSHFLSMNAFEPLLWMGCAYIAIVIFQGGDERLWLAFGGLAGLGLENKHTTLFFGSAFFLALLLTPQRTHLRRVWIWLGGAIALLIFLPNLLWEVQHHFATIELLRNIARSHKNADLSPLGFLLQQLLLMHPLTFPVWLAGLVWLLRRPPYRVLGLTWLILLAEFLVLKGKVYYLAPSYPMLFAAGAIAIDEWAKVRALRPAFLALLALTGAIVAPIALPILPVDTYIAYSSALHLTPPATENHRMGPLPQQYADMFGWPEMAAVVARAYNRLTPAERARCGIFGQNYGQAGAIDFYGRRLGLPPAISGHQNYYLWGPGNFRGDILIVMDDDRETLEKLFHSVEEVGVVGHPYAMPYENGKPVHLCRGLKMPIEELWPKVKKWI